jgi:hypothetical protein
MAMPARATALRKGLKTFMWVFLFNHLLMRAMGISVCALESILRMDRVLHHWPK